MPHPIVPLRFIAETVVAASSRGTAPKKTLVTETIDVEKCGPCHGDAFRRGNFKGATTPADDADDPSAVEICDAQVSQRRRAFACWAGHTR